MVFAAQVRRPRNLLEKDPDPMESVTPSASAATAARAFANFIDYDSTPDTDPDSSFWSGASRLIVEGGFYGQPIPGHRSDILLQWTPSSLYLLFVCPYQLLNLKPNPDLTAETYELWNWDVAEVFIGDDFTNIRRYKEFEVSPQGEWVDLDVNLDNPPHEVGWVWQSGCEVAARIDEARKTWYGFMRIPWPSIDRRAPAVGNELLVNFFRCQGSDPNRKYIAWRPVHRPSFHTPESFGILKLAGPKISR
jgi:hypothetical protein